MPQQAPIKPPMRRESAVVPTPRERERQLPWTIRDMLCHRCGLARHELAWYSRLDQYGEKEYLEMLKYLDSNVPFRYKMQYQNVMFAMAGIVIHQVSGLGTLTLTGLHYRAQYFLFREDHVLPGVELPGTVDYDVNVKVTGISIALELRNGKMIHFKKQD